MISKTAVGVAYVDHSAAVLDLCLYYLFHLFENVGCTSLALTEIFAQTVEVKNVISGAEKKTDRFGKRIELCIFNLVKKLHTLFPVKHHSLGKDYCLVKSVSLPERLVNSVAVGGIEELPGSCKALILGLKSEPPYNAVVHRTVVAEHYVYGIVLVALLKELPRRAYLLCLASAVIGCGKTLDKRLLVGKILHSHKGKLTCGFAHYRGIVSEVPALKHTLNAPFSCALILVEDHTGNGNIRNGCKLVRAAYLHLCKHVLSGLHRLVCGVLEKRRGAYV